MIWTALESGTIDTSILRYRRVVTHQKQKYLKSIIWLTNGLFPTMVIGWYHLTDIQLFYLILVEMLKGTPVCNLYVFGLELSSKAIIITQRNTNTEAWYMIMNFQHTETRNSKTNRRHSSINCEENKMQLSGTIKGNNSASGKKSSTTSK